MASKFGKVILAVAAALLGLLILGALVSVIIYPPEYVVRVFTELESDVDTYRVAAADVEPRAACGQHRIQMQMRVDKRGAYQVTSGIQFHFGPVGQPGTDFGKPAVFDRKIHQVLFSVKTRVSDDQIHFVYLLLQTGLS